jgi:hypothetical protein
MASDEQARWEAERAINEAHQRHRQFVKDIAKATYDRAGEEGYSELDRNILAAAVGRLADRGVLRPDR